MKAISKLALMGLVTVLLQGCAAEPRFSQLVGERYFVTSLDTYPLLISSVDGKSFTTSPQFVEPGVRQLVLQGPPGGAGFSALMPFTLQVEPCTRYYIVAVKASPLDTQFTPRVDYRMPLSTHCKAATS